MDNSEQLIWESELDKLFEKIQKSDSDLLMDILTIVVFNRFNSKIGKLYKIIGDMDKFTEILKEFSNEDIRLPDINDFKEALILALVYYYKNVQGFSWEEIQSLLKYEKDIPIRYGKRVASIDRTIQKQLNEILNKKKSKKETIFELE